MVLYFNAFDLRIGWLAICHAGEMKQLRCSLVSADLPESVLTCGLEVEGGQRGEGDPHPTPTHPLHLIVQQGKGSLNKSKVFCKV